MFPSLPVQPANRIRPINAPTSLLFRTQIHLFLSFSKLSLRSTPISSHSSVCSLQAAALNPLLYHIKLQMSTKCKKINKNTKNYFILSGREGLYFRQEVAVLFKPYNKTKNRTNTSITPAFNNDRRHYTYSFTLPSSPPENPEQLQADHRKRVAESLVEIEDILMPKPRSKHKYCGVCRSHYQDYKEHTEGPDHLGFLKRSMYQLMIVEACKHFQGYHTRRQQKDAEDSKIEQMSDESLVKIVSESSETFTPQKVSSVGFQ